MRGTGFNGLSTEASGWFYWLLHRKKGESERKIRGRMKAGDLNSLPGQSLVGRKSFSKH